MKPITKSAIIMAILVVVFIGGWELYLRSTGVTLSYDEGKELWADKRARVYQSPSTATVFIGSSRIKFDLDIDAWQKLTGRKAIQLSMEGNSPVPLLEDLAADPRFAGKLVVDVTEFAFFAAADAPGRHEQKENIDYYKNRTPAQRASFILNHALESQLVFLDQAGLSLNAQLDNLSIPNRPNVMAPPLFPLDFSRVTFDRQDKMSPRFLADTNLQRRVQNIWVFLRGAGAAYIAQHPEDPAPAIMQRVVAAVAKIKSRGGEVVFVRTPCSGPMAIGEAQGYPRNKYWEPLLAATQCKGIHFKDDPATDHFICPEWSHLSPSDAVVYTRALIGHLPESFVH
jgi:hypothetical protein